MVFHPARELECLHLLAQPRRERPQLVAVGEAEQALCVERLGVELVQPHRQLDVVLERDEAPRLARVAGARLERFALARLLDLLGAFEEGIEGPELAEEFGSAFDADAFHAFDVV